MVERDAKVKQAPERWQEERSQFQLVITFDRRVFESVVDGNDYCCFVRIKRINL
jgi:hypothetical protein